VTVVTGLLDPLVDRLAGTAIGTTFNQYLRGGAEDRDPAAAPAIRRANLRAYLAAHACAPVLAVAEAAGWRGARYSGIPLLSERQIDEASTAYRRTSACPHGFAEASATVVRGLLRAHGWEDAVLVWNVVPTHPCGPDPHSNRPPSRAEVAAGRELLLRLLDVVRPVHVVAIGRTAAGALPPDLGAVAVRHPAQSGAALCRRQLVEALSAWLG
jgi:hypothetical protein